MRFSLTLLGTGMILALLLTSAICFADTVPLYANGNVLAAGNYNSGHGSSDITLAIRMLADGNIVVNEGDAVKYFVAYDDEPAANDALGNWTEPGFDDSSWADGFSSVGYDDGDDNTEIDNKKATTGDEQVDAIFTRYSFDLGPAPSAIEFLVDYDDSFVIWINGVEVGRSSNLDADGDIPDWSVGSDGPTGGGHGSSELPANDEGRWTHGDTISLDLVDFAFDAGSAVRPADKLAATWAGIKSAE